MINPGFSPFFQTWPGRRNLTERCQATSFLRALLAGGVTWYPFVFSCSFSASNQTRLQKLQAADDVIVKKLADEEHSVSRMQRRKSS